MRGLWAGVAGVCLGTWCLSAGAQPKWAVDQIYTGNIELGGVQAPLPQGEWIVTGFERSITKSGWGNMTVALAQFKETQVPAYVVLIYNEQSVRMGWNVGEEKQCARREIHHAKVIRDTQLDKACLYVNHIVFNVSSGSAKWWKDTIDYARKRNAKIPMAAIQGGIVTSDRANFLSMAYYFNPEVEGFGPPQNTVWQTSDWNVLNVAGDQKKQAYVQAVIDWTEQSRPMLEAGLAGKLKKGEALNWPSYRRE